jgi:hypothetical protein
MIEARSGAERGEQHRLTVLALDVATERADRENSDQLSKNSAAPIARIKRRAQTKTAASRDQRAGRFGRPNRTGS